MTETEELRKEVMRLKDRVSFLEEEMGESLAEREFEGDIRRWFDGEVSVEEQLGRFYAEGKLDPNRMKEVARRVEQREDIVYDIYEEDGEVMLWVETRDRKI